MAKKAKEESAYVRLGYTSLHILKETRVRFTRAVSRKQIQEGRVVTNDEMLNLLLDRLDNSVINGQPQEAIYEPAS